MAGDSSRTQQTAKYFAKCPHPTPTSLHPQQKNNNCPQAGFACFQFHEVHAILLKGHTSDSWCSQAGVSEHLHGVQCQWTRLSVLSGHAISLIYKYPLFQFLLPVYLDIDTPVLTTTITIKLLSIELIRVKLEKRKQFSCTAGDHHN